MDIETHKKLCEITCQSIHNSIYDKEDIFRTFIDGRCHINLAKLSSLVYNDIMEILRQNIKSVEFKEMKK